MNCRKLAAIRNSFVLAMIPLAAIALFVSACTGNVATDKALRALGAQGVTSVTLTGYSFFGCSSNEYYSTGFKGVGANGNHVSGVVCSAFLKGVTVRYD